MSEATVDYSARTVWVDHAMTPADFTGLEASIAALERAMIPATREERMASLGELLTVFPLPALNTESERRVRWDVYHKALGDLPADVLKVACEGLMRTATFFPKPADIRAAAEKSIGPRIVALGKLRAMQKFQVRARGDETRERTPEEQANVQRLATLLRRSVQMNVSRGMSDK